MTVFCKESPLFGLLGYPLSHSLSPALHSRALAQLAACRPTLQHHLEAAGGAAAAYALYAMEPAASWAHWLQQRFQEGLVGLNVTLPYKVALMQHVASSDATADCCGAANTLVRTPLGYRAYNTDVAGMLHVLRARWPQGSPGVVWVLGAGGAARAAVVAAWQLGASRVVVSSRTEARAQAMVDHLRTQARLHSLPYTPVEQVPWDQKEACLRDACLQPAVVIQATPLGLHPGDPLPVSPAALPPAVFCLDLVYGPAQVAGHTPWTLALQQQGIACQAGLEVLRAQAAVAMQHWLSVLGVEPLPWEALAKAYCLG